MYLVIILLVFGAAVFVLSKRVNYTKENVLEELDANTNKLPKRALIKSDILFRIVDRDMSLGRKNSLIFFYKEQQHIIGVEMYKDKLIFRYDDKLYMTLNDLKNTAIIGDRRLADIDDKVTLVKIIYPDTKIEAILENDTLLKDYIIDGNDKLYDLNIKFSEIK